MKNTRISRDLLLTKLLGAKVSIVVIAIVAIVFVGSVVVSQFPGFANSTVSQNQTATTTSQVTTTLSSVLSSSCCSTTTVVTVPPVPSSTVYLSSQTDSTETSSTFVETTQQSFTTIQSAVNSSNSELTSSTYSATSIAQSSSYSYQSSSIAQSTSFIYQSSSGSTMQSTSLIYQTSNTATTSITEQYSSQASIAVQQAWTQGQSGGGISSVNLSFPSSVSSGDYIVIGITYLFDSSNPTINAPTDSHSPFFAQLGIPSIASPSAGEVFKSEWFISQASSSGFDGITISTNSAVNSLCGSIFDITGISGSSNDSNYGSSYSNSFSTSPFGIPNPGVSLSTSASDSSSVSSYSAGLGYSLNSNSGGSCAGEYSTSAPSPTTAPMSSATNVNWLESGISFGPSFT